MSTLVIALAVGALALALTLTLAFALGHKRGVNQGWLDRYFEECEEARSRREPNGRFKRSARSEP